MLKAYRDHAAERAALGIPPLPLDAKQVAELIELIKNPPAGEEAFLLDLRGHGSVLFTAAIDPATGVQETPRRIHFDIRGQISSDRPADSIPATAVALTGGDYLGFEPRGERLAAQDTDALGHPLQLLLVANVCSRQSTRSVGQGLGAAARRACGGSAALLAASQRTRQGHVSAAARHAHRDPGAHACRWCIDGQGADRWVPSSRPIAVQQCLSAAAGAAQPRPLPCAAPVT